MKNNYYVYVYLNPLKPGKFIYLNCGLGIDFDYEPFYIGKGQGSRLISHLKEALKFTLIEKESITEEKYNKHKINTINKIIRNGKNPIIYKIISEINNDNANLLEKIFIRLIGRHDKKLGPLTNLTDGGEGTTGKICKEETKNKMSKIHKGKHIKPNLTQEQRQKKRERILGNKNPTKRIEVGDKISKSLKNSVKARGKIWIHIKDVEACIKEEDIDSYLPFGWIRGRKDLISNNLSEYNKRENKNKTTNTVWVHKIEDSKIIRKRIKESKVSEYIGNGWIYGIADHTLPEELISMFYNTTMSIANIGKLFGLNKCYMMTLLRKTLGNEEYDRVVLYRKEKRKSKVA